MSSVKNEKREVTKELLHELFIIDFDNGVMIWRVPPKQHPRLYGCIAGAINGQTKKYCKIMVQTKRHLRGDLIYLAYHGVWALPYLDHINGISTDDRICNLRPATPMQNCWNRKTSGVEHRKKLPVGVTARHGGKFQARIGYRGKLLHIGSYTNPDDASAAYQAKRRELRGEFA